MTGRRQYRHPERSSALHLLCAARNAAEGSLFTSFAWRDVPIRDHRPGLGLCGVPRNAAAVLP